MNQQALLNIRGSFNVVSQKASYFSNSLNMPIRHDARISVKQDVLNKVLAVIGTNMYGAPNMYIYGTEDVFSYE
jgi:hypothetical protein